MTETFFLDTNVLMYAVGGEHPLKKPSIEILRQAAEEEILAVTDTEVFQEIAYRYWSQKKWSVAVRILRDYQYLFTEIYPIEKGHLDVYYALFNDYDFLSPRDAIHIAVMKAHNLRDIITADASFKDVPFLKVHWDL